MLSECQPSISLLRSSLVRMPTYLQALSHFIGTASQRVRAAEARRTKKKKEHNDEIK
jgi:hypothetical protein